MGKLLYKVELTGWVVKDDEDSDVMDWSIESITNDMVGFEIQTTLVDSSEWTHIPIYNSKHITDEPEATTTTITEGQVGINPIPLHTVQVDYKDLVTPNNQTTTHLTVPYTDTPPTHTIDLEGVMDIELDTKGMTL